MSRLSRMGLMVAALIAAAGYTAPARGADLTSRTEALEKQIEELRKDLVAIKSDQAQQDKETARKIEESLAQSQNMVDGLRNTTLSLFERIKVGGYGSGRYEANSLREQSNTFTLRRLVLTTDAKIAPRIRFFSEIEYERFRKLEIERTTFQRTEGGLEVVQAVEGTPGSELAIEQAWVQYDIMPWLNFRAGAILVPLGRFNLHHDDNLWNLPRRSLVDRGVPVLPSTAAWDELGLGFLGQLDIGNFGLLDYQLYVMNGVTLDSEVENVIETRTGDTAKFEAEVEVQPSTGTFSQDFKNAKALAGRLAWQPAPGHEIAPSFYWGRYTPSYLPSESVWSIGIDGITTHGPFQLEGEGVFTRFEGVPTVAKSFAQVVGNQVSEGETGGVETEVKFKLANLASTKIGYWLEARYSIWPRFLNGTFLEWQFNDPQIIPTLRWEQVWLDGLVEEAAFNNGVLTGFSTDNRIVNRITAGLAYRPTPLVVFQLAYEYTWTNQNKSLAQVTNFIPAGPNESDLHSVMFGVGFGF